MSENGGITTIAEEEPTKKTGEKEGCRRTGGKGEQKPGIMMEASGMQADEMGERRLVHIEISGIEMGVDIMIGRKQRTAGRIGLVVMNADEGT